MVIISKVKLLFNKLLSFQVIIPIGVILIGIIALNSLSEYTIQSFEDELVDNRKVDLQYYGNMVTGEISVGENGLISVSADLSKEIEMISDFYSGRVVVMDSGCRIIKDTYVIDEERYAVSPEILQVFEGSSYSKLDRTNHSMELILPITDHMSGEVKGALFISSSTMDIYKNVRSNSQKNNVLIVILELFLILAAFLLSQMIRASFDRTHRSLVRIGDGNLDAPIYRSRIYELHELTEQYEEIRKRLRYQDQSRQEFVSNVSHELKTPIASMKVLADSLLLQKGMDVPTEIYEEFMTDISAELDRETQIISDLLTLSKLDHGSDEILNYSQVDIGNLIEQNLKRLRPLAKKREIELIYESIRPYTAEVDESRLSLAVMNLIENAIKYNRDGGWVKVVCDADHRYCYIRIADSGVGIPEEELPYIFERFYRVDKARSRETGGTGLGLSIARSIVSLHGGGIRVSSVHGEGTTFTIRIPLRHV